MSGKSSYSPLLMQKRSYSNGTSAPGGSSASSGSKNPGDSKSSSNPNESISAPKTPLRDYSDNIYVLVYARLDGELQHSHSLLFKDQVSRALKHIDFKDIPVSCSVEIRVFYDVCGPDTPLTQRKG
jgi:hypothetical protein